MNTKARILSATLAFIISATSAASVASAVTTEAVSREGTSVAAYDGSLAELYESYGYAPHSYSNMISVQGVANKNVSAYQRPSIYINGTQTSVKGIRINDTLYLPFRVAAGLVGASYSYDSASRTSTMTASGLVATATDGAYCIYANGRPLFATTPTVIMSDGRMYIPAESFARMVGMTLTDSGERASVSGKFRALATAESYYREDEVLWLARIIHAEAQGEPLLGQIAVGNVVLNRVKSAYYPNTIYGVIFDRKYGVQFSPILNGTIYNTPSYSATLAAKICLEGFDISDGAFFFLEPRLSTSSWIPTSREYAFTIGHHDFYK